MSEKNIMAAPKVTAPSAKSTAIGKKSAFLRKKRKKAEVFLMPSKTNKNAVIFANTAARKMQDYRAKRKKPSPFPVFVPVDR